MSAKNQFHFLDNPWNGFPEDRNVSGWFELYAHDEEGNFDYSKRFWSAPYSLWFFGIGFIKTPFHVAYEEDWRGCQKQDVAPASEAELFFNMRTLYPYIDKTRADLEMDLKRLYESQKSQ